MDVFIPISTTIFLSVLLDRVERRSWSSRA
jgi:hypothetical protein